MNNVVIERASQFNFLGVILNFRLKCDKDIAHICLKISRVSGVLFRLKHIYPLEVLLTLYNTLIFPYLNYCILVWGSKIYTDHRLHLLPKKVVRTIKKKDYIAHTVPGAITLCATD